MGTTRSTRSRRRKALTAVLVAVAAGLAVPATGGTPTAHAAVRKHVDTDYTLLRRAPASYVIGTAYRDWTADIHGDQQDGYRWARVYGNLNKCLWIYSGAVSGDEAIAASCGDPVTMQTSEFTNGQIGGGTSDGATVMTAASTRLCHVRRHSHHRVRQRPPVGGASHPECAAEQPGRHRPDRAVAVCDQGRQLRDGP